MASNSRAQRLIEEFSEGAFWHGPGSFSIGHGIASLLRHLADTESVYSDDGTFYGVRTSLLEGLAEALTAPTLLDRALAGDAQAARQFLHEAGFTDVYGQWLPQYQLVAEDDVDLYLEQ